MTEQEAFITAILLDRLDDAPRLVYADWLDERGENGAMLRTGNVIVDASDGDGDISGGGGGNGDGVNGNGNGDCNGNGDDNDSGDGGVVGGDGGGDGGDGGDGYIGDGADGYGDRGTCDYSSPKGTLNMTDGLYILSISSGYYPYVLVGWVRVCGLELRLTGARVISRYGRNVSLAQLAKSGVAVDTKLLAPSDIEDIWRPKVSRALRANELAWIEECPKPKDWEV